MCAAPATDAEAWLSLSLIRGVPPQALRRLLAAFGAPEGVLAAGSTALAREVAPQVARAIARGADRAAVDAALDWLGGAGNHVVTLADGDYPRALLEIADPPPLLYLKGRRELLNRPALAVVGSRNATAQGIDNAEHFAHVLSDAGLTIVSGLALGIDAAAHRGGLRGVGSSIALVGTGLDIVYPARNRALAQTLAESGALISEFPLGTRALGSNFPRRNRLISGMSRGCLVVEAAISSGSLITARAAVEQGRDVFAIPGSIHSALSKGCHALIKQGAKLVESAQDVLEELGLAAAPAAAGVGPPEVAVDGAAQMLLEQLGFDPCDLDTLCRRSGLAADAVMTLLLQLELAGRVAPLAGGRYQRRR
ncbi:MAG TPA: DNA-processing protein DprA [Burkholderiales bacterium]|nr:DNA-processing protein DprA [Burkholderiales bacterium]